MRSEVCNTTGVPYSTHVCAGVSYAVMSDCPRIFKFLFSFYIGVYLTYYVVFVSGAQQSDLLLHIHLPILL